MANSIFKQSHFIQVQRGRNFLCFWANRKKKSFYIDRFTLKLPSSWQKSEIALVANSNCKIRFHTSPTVIFAIHIDRAAYHLIKGVMPAYRNYTIFALRFRDNFIYSAYFPSLKELDLATNTLPSKARVRLVKPCNALLWVWAKGH